LTDRLRAEELELPAHGDRHFRNSSSAEIFDGGQRWLSISTEPRSRRTSWTQGRFDSQDIESGEEIDSSANDPRVSPDGRWLAWGNWHGRDAAITRLGSHDPPVVLPIAGSASVGFSADSHMLATGGPEDVRFYEVGTLRLVHSILRRPSRPLRPEFAFMHASSLCAVALPPDEILLVDTKTGAELATLPARSCILWNVSVSSDDRFLAATSSDHRVLIWDFVKLRHELGELGLDW
jgi:WD40 repeat protein